MHGTVVRLVPAEGFGIIRDEGGDEYFLHVTAMSDTPFEAVAVGSEVEFTPSPRDQGDRADELPRASHVHLADRQLPAVDNEMLPPEKLGRE